MTSPILGWKHFLVFGGGGVCVGEDIGSPVFMNSLSYQNFTFEHEISTHWLVLLLSWDNDEGTHYQVNGGGKVLKEENKMKKGKNANDILKHAISEYCSRN